MEHRLFGPREAGEEIIIRHEKREPYGTRSGIYLDVCCLNRPFDDQRQERIRLEAEAVLLILSICEDGRLRLLGREAVDLEISFTPDERRQKVTPPGFAGGIEGRNKR